MPWTPHRLGKHKMEAVAKRDASRRSGGLVQFDDACLGGERTGCKTDGGTPGVAGNGVMDNVKCATSGRYQTAKQGNRARRYSARACGHFQRRSHLATMPSWLLYAAMPCNRWPEQVCALSKTFMAERLNLIRCGLRAPSMPLVVQRRPAPVVNAVPFSVYIVRRQCEFYAMTILRFCEPRLNTADQKGWNLHEPRGHPQPCPDSRRISATEH